MVLSVFDWQATFDAVAGAAARIIMHDNIYSTGLTAEVEATVIEQKAYMRGVEDRP